MSVAHDEARSAARDRFLAQTPWSGARLEPLVPDASPRLYFRLIGGPSRAVLVDAPGAATEPPCPPGADEEQRRELGYVACARLAGNALAAGRAAADVLRSCGIDAPRTLEALEAEGFAIVEEVVGEPLANACEDEGAEDTFYRQAAELLLRLEGCSAGPDAAEGWTYQTYDRLAYETEVALLHEWYLPGLIGRKLEDDEIRRLDAAWNETFATLSEPRSWVHRDFHAENIISTAKGLAVIDFQDMMIGQAAYDWVSLIEDARRDVSVGVARAVHAIGVQAASDPGRFETDYAVLAAQRNAKILGLFTRLAHRDGKKRYLGMIDRVRRHFLADLARPAVRPVKTELEDIAPELFRD
jgi:aminoglycoside/choline kinase family phosphotransferase